MAENAFPSFDLKKKSVCTNSKKLCAVYGNGVIAESMTPFPQWCARFKSGNFSLGDRERSGRSAVSNDKQIKTLIKNNPEHRTQDITFGIPFMWTL